MSSSSSSRRTKSRVLRSASGAVGAPTHLLDLDLAAPGLSRLDPARLDAAVEQGFVEGYAAGTAAGRADADAEQAEIAMEHRRQLDRVVAATEEALREAIAAVHASASEAALATAAAAFAIAEAVVGRELAISASPGRDAVARALSLAPEGVELVVRLHPDDAQDLLMGGTPAWDSVRLAADPTVARGDCLVQGGWTRIDARIAAALERVRAVLEVTP